MSAVDLAMPRMMVEEGFRSKTYRDTQGFLTIGYGFNVDAGITEPCARALLRAQADEIHTKLLQYTWYAALDVPRQSACLDMAFNLGLGAFPSKWPRLVAALSRKDWVAAQAECVVTKTPEVQQRYNHLGQIFLTGMA